MWWVSTRFGPNAENGQADAGRNSRTYFFAGPDYQARTRTGTKHFRCSAVRIIGKIVEQKRRLSLVRCRACWTFPAISRDRTTNSYYADQAFCLILFEMYVHHKSPFEFFCVPGLSKKQLKSRFLFTVLPTYTGTTLRTSGPVPADSRGGERHRYAN